MPATLRGSAWLNFQRVKCAQWSHFNGNSHVVLMGDAVHTAHFAIGSGTKLALEDAIELVRQFKALGDTADRIPEVLKHYQAVREIDVIRLQNAAWNAMEWFEVCGERYCDQLEPEQFMYSMLTRSQRISHENLRLRDKAWLEGLRGLVRRPHKPPRAFVPTHVHALYPTLGHPQKPRGGLAHGAIHGGGRPRGRRPLGALGRTRHGRCRAGDGRDDCAQCRRPHHARLPGFVE